jgi:hypothetical protein
MLGGSKNLSTVMMTTIGMFLVACVVLGFLRTGTAASEPEPVEKFD